MSDNIIFMGTSKFAVPILEKVSESKLNISAVYTQPPKKSSRGMRIQKTPIHVKSELLSLPIRTPNSLKNKNYSEDRVYREDFKTWIEKIWQSKDSNIEKLKI